MRLTCELRYPAADPAAVFAMIGDTDFQERKCVATGAVEHDVDVEEFEDGSATVTTRRTLPTDQVPDFVRTFVGATVTVSQVDDWGPPSADGGRDGTTVVEIAGAPVRMTGTLRLVAEGDGAVQYVDGDVKASVPLIGGKIEKAVLPAIEGAIRVEQRVSTAWLDER
jgi:hypothetical protein